MIMTATVMLTKLAMNVMVKMKMVMTTTTMKTMVSLRANKKVYYVCLRVRSCVCDGCSQQAKKRNKENHITHVTFVNVVLQLNSMFQRHSA